MDILSDAQKIVDKSYNIKETTASEEIKEFLAQVFDQLQTKIGSMSDVGLFDVSCDLNMLSNKPSVHFTKPVLNEETMVVSILEKGTSVPITTGLVFSKINETGNRKILNYGFSNPSHTPMTDVYKMVGLATGMILSTE